MTCTTTTELTIQRGASLDLHFFVKDEAGAAIDITGARVWMCVLSCDDATVHAFDKDSDVVGDVTFDDAAAGEFTIHILPADTIDLTGSEYLYEVWIELATGERYALIPRSKLFLSASLCATPPV